MPPSVAVLIPWRPTPDRWGPLSWVTRRLHQARQRWSVFDDAQIILCADSPIRGGPWRKARAVAAGIADTDADVIVVHDADTWCDGTRLAVEDVIGGAPWAMPHRMVHRLKSAPTAALLAGDLDEPPMGPCVRRPYVGWAGGGIVVLRRDTYEHAPLDPRFAGWGQEDASWALALTTMAGPCSRGDAPLTHLWHEEAPRLTSVYGSNESRWLHDQYRRAAGREADMRLLLDGARRG